MTGLLAIDIGNTGVKCAVFEGEDAVARARFSTDSERGWQGYAQDLRQALLTAGVTQIGGAVIASVVRGMAGTLGTAVARVWGVAPVVADTTMDLGIRVRVPQPERVGIDRLLAAGAAYDLFGGPVVIGALGSAMTVDLVSDSGHFLGGPIAPGIETGLRALHARTSLLPEVRLAAPEGVLGTNTVDCMRAGGVYGTAGALDRLFAELKAVSGGHPVLVLTGGDAAFLAPYLKTPCRLVPDLVLLGLVATYRRQ